MSKNIYYRLASLDEREDLADLFKKYYFPNEPFNSGWINDEPVPEDIDWTLKLLDEGTSFVAVDTDKNIIVGACLTGVDDTSSGQVMLDVAKQTKHKKWSQYLKMYALLDEQANICKRYNVEKVFHVSAVVVNNDYRGHSIATKLVEKSFALGASLGFLVCSLNCSSFYTERIAMGLKMECVNELAMADIKSEEGERLVYTLPPHTHIRTYAKWLNEKN